MSIFAKPHGACRVDGVVLGRWLVPDPAGLAAVNPSNPQTWNRYAYVGNNPLSFVDPPGLKWIVMCFGYPEGGGACTWVWTVDASDACPRDGCDRPLDPSHPQRDPKEPIDKKPANNGPKQTFSQCMAANSSTFSLAGLAQGAVNAALNAAGMSSVNFKDNPVVGAFLGNSISGTLFGSPGEAGTSAATNTPGLLNMAMGTVTTYGRNTSTITSLNIARTGGLPQALSSASGGLKSVLGAADSVLSLGMSFSQRLAIDAALTGAEAAYCAYVAR